MMIAYKKVFLLCLISFISLQCLAQEQSDRDKLLLNKRLLRYVKTSQSDSVIQLIKRGADPNASSSSGISALMYATEASKTDNVNILLHNGADPNRQPKNGFSALMHACYTNQFEVAYTLARYGAKLELQDSHGATALHYATYAGNYDLMDMLLFYKANANAKAKDGNAPLHIAMFIQDTALAALLLHHGADINAKNKKGFTPLMLAAQENNTDVLHFLLSKNADITSVKDTITTALSYAIIRQNDSAFYQLLEKVDVKKYGKDNAQNDFRLSKYTQNNTYRKALLSKGFERDYMPRLLGLSFQNGFNFNANDIMFRWEAGAWEYRYNTKVAIGFSHRAVRKSILLEAGEDIYYQVFEKKKILDLAFQKRFQLIPDVGTPYGFGLYLEDRFQLALGRYVGLERKLDQRFFNSITAGTYVFSQGFFMGIGYVYAPFQYQEISNHRIEINFAYVPVFLDLPATYYPKWL